MSPPDRYESDKVIWEFGSEMPEAARPGGPGVDQQPSPSQDDTGAHDEGDRMLRHVAAIHGMPIPGSNEWSEAEEVARWRTEAGMYGRLFGEYRRVLHDLLAVVDDLDSSDRSYAIHMARSLDARYGRPE